jgi:hypothetical protein
VSSETLERAQAIRAAIHSPGWHREDGLAALDALLAEVARLEQERDEAKHQRDNFERIAREQAERAHANWKRAEAAEAALAVAREREQRLREQVERIALNAESWHGYLPPDNAPGAGHVRALGVIATWARAALVDEPAAATLAEPGRRGANEPAVGKRRGVTFPAPRAPQQTNRERRRHEDPGSADIKSRFYVTFCARRCFPVRQGTAMSESLCMCGHECRAHPNVGRIASWPTRCLYCECLEFKPREEAAERERDDLGPLFIRDACRILDVDEHDISRMDALARRASAAPATPRPGRSTATAAGRRCASSGAGQGRRYGFRMMDSPEADLPRMSDELREAVREAKP